MKRVAVIGASRDPGKFGWKAVQGFLRQGCAVIPVNPREKEIEGLEVYESVLDVPGPIDMATIYVPPAEGFRVLEEIAEKQIPEVWLNPGADSPELVAHAHELGLSQLLRVVLWQLVSQLGLVDMLRIESYTQ